MNGREWHDEMPYRYSFNGKEGDVESEFAEVLYDYGFRIYDPRIAKFLSVDPLTMSYPMLTPYQFASNTPICSIDLDGLEAKLAIMLETHPELNQFNDHLKDLTAKGYLVLKMKSGEELLSAIKNNSSLSNPIIDLIIISHSANRGLFGQNGNDNGFYSPAGALSTAEDKVELDVLQQSGNSVVELLKVQGTAEYQKMIEDYQKEMSSKGARTTDDLSKMVENQEIVFDKKAQAILLGGCLAVLVNPDGTVNSSIATKVAEATKQTVVGSSTETSPVHNSPKRNGKWYKISSDGKKAAKIPTGGTIDLTTRTK